MNPKIDWSELFFSSSGRSRQMPFCVALGVLWLALILYESLAKGPLLYLTGWIIYPALLFCAACILSKRLHDRGRSGWWSAVILIAFAMAWPAPVGFFQFLAVIFLVWAAIDLCVMPGERGDNRYGRTLFRLTPSEQN